MKRYPKVLTICQPMLRKETPSSPIHNYINVITITTLSHLPLLFLFRYHQINRCYIYNIYYYSQRCESIALPPLFSSLFRCDSACCFLYTYSISASNISLYILHFAPYLLPSTILCILYNIISIYSPQTTLVFYNRAMLCSTHHICA